MNGAKVEAIFDTAALYTIVRRSVVRSLGARLVRRFAVVDGVARDVASIAVKADVKSGGHVSLIAIVDDALIACVGPVADMILGRDYIQGQRRVIYLSKAEETAAAKCRPPIQPLSRRRLPAELKSLLGKSSGEPARRRNTPRDQGGRS